MANGKVEIDTEIKTDKAKKELKNLKGDLDKFVNKFKASSLGGLFTGMTIGIKASTKALKESTEALNQQIVAEKQLEVAAKNNPYLNSSAVQKLKELSAEYQNISGIVGDEQILQFMSQLASAGRTQQEIQKIIEASMDIAASGTMSMDNAVTQLNATFSGNIGLMGRQFAELKTLTKEELESGKAVDILSKKFEGLAKEVTDATGTYQLMKNAQGDFNEALGKMTKPTVDEWNTFWTAFYKKGVTAIEAINGAIDNMTDRKAGKKITDGLLKYFKNSNDDASMKIEFKRQADMYSDRQLALIKAYLDNKTNLTKQELFLQSAIQGEINARIIETKETEKAAKAQQLLNQQQEEENAKQKSRDDLRAEYDKKIEQAKKEISIRRSLGEEISKQEEAQDLLNVATDAYIEMMSDPLFNGNSGNYEHETNARSQIAQWAEDAKALPETENEFIEFSKKLKEMTQTEKEAKEEEIRLLDVEMDHLSAQDKLKVWDDYVKARKKLSDEITAIEEAEVKQQKEKTAEMITTINGYISQFADISNTMTNMLSKANEAQMNDQLTNISKQYTDGLIAYEEYCEKKDEISKQAAREQYKIDMWTWTASLLEATANIAQGVSKAIAQGGTYGIVTGALVAASGAAQIASIAASKPKTPSFATGGIVPGTSYTGDRVRANVNSGEMILNTAQQAQLWKMANGNSNGGGIKLNVDVTNNMGSEAKISQQITPRGLRITVDRIVNAGFKDGRYNNGLQAAQNISNGVSYL